VTAELFIKNNVVDFAKNLPTNPYSTTKRRESRSPSKDIRSDNAQSPLLDNVHIDESLHLKNLQSERSAISIYQVDSDSSDDESDSVDIGFKRKRRNRTKSNWEKREATSQRRIRSLSEAICDIEARTKAAKEEMDKIVSRTQSESTTSGETSSDASNDEKNVSRRKEAHKQRSSSAIETFQKLLSSDSETNSDRGSGTRRRSLKNLQKTPWIQSKDSTIRSSSQYETNQMDADTKIQPGGKGSRESEQKQSSTVITNGALIRDDRDLLISIIENANNELDFQAKLHKLDTVSSMSVDADIMKEQADLKATAKSSIEKQKEPSNCNSQNDEIIVVESLKLGPVYVNGHSRQKDDTATGKRLGQVNGLKSLREIEEEAVAPRHLPQDERVESLIDLLEETSCDSIEEENYRRKLSNLEGKSFDSSWKTPDDKCRNELELESKNFDIKVNSHGATASNKNEFSALNPLSHERSSTSIGKSLSDNAESEASNADIKVVKKRVLKAKSGHIVRSKSVHGVYGLRNFLDPEKLSFVEECEWLDKLMQTELETMKRRKLEEATAPLPKAESEKRPPQLFTREETIDEASINLGDSRKLVKRLLDMEAELRKEKEEHVKMRRKKIERNKQFLERRKSMPVGQDALREAEAMVLNEKELELDSNVSLNSEQAVSAKESVNESQKDSISYSKISIGVMSNIENARGISRNKGKTDKISQGREHESKPENTTLERKETHEREKNTNKELKHVAPNTDPVTQKGAKEKTDDKKLNKLQHQNSFEENRPLKHIKTFKNMFEDKSVPTRPIDNYHRSLSVEVRPLGLGRGRSKSFGEGLNRPSEDSKHIHVFEKQPSLERSGKRRESASKREKDIVYYEEAIVNANRKESREGNRATEEDVKVHDGSLCDIEKTKKSPTLEETSIPIFKKVDDFKQIFEGEKQGMSTIPKKKVAVVKQSELKGESNNRFGAEQSQVKDLTYNGKDKILLDNDEAELKRIGKSKLSKSKEDSPDLIENTRNGKAVSTDDLLEENIPSIQDRLLLFRNTSEQAVEAKRKEKSSMKIRPTSLHSDGEMNLSHLDSGSQPLHLTGTMNPAQEKYIRELGESMIESKEGTSEQASSLGSTKQSLKYGTKKVNETFMTDSLPTHNLEKKNLAASRQEKALEEFSYVKVVKDDRIRRELEEQEVREAEIREKLNRNSAIELEKVTRNSAVENPSKVVERQTKGKTSSGKLENQVSQPLHTLPNRTKEHKIVKNEMEREIKNNEPLRKLEASIEWKSEKDPVGVGEEDAKNSQNLRVVKKVTDLQEAERVKDENENITSKDVNLNNATRRIANGSLKSRKLPSKIELELEEERRRELELVEERKQREKEQNKLLEEQRKLMEAMEAEKKRMQKEELAKQNAIREEKMKRQEKTRGLRALFEAS